MSIGSILTLGYGQFGNVNLLPTLGYGESVAPPPTPPQNESIPTGGGGVRGRQYIERLSKREEMLERIALGILPEQIEEAQAAVEVAVRAEVRLDTASNGGDELQTAHQAERAAREAYVAVYREYMHADAIIEQYRRDVTERRNQIRRAAATLLLLH